MSTMPGFAGEASLCSVSSRYQATTELTVGSGLVQPVGLFSDSTTLDTSLFAVFGPVYTPRPFPCLKWVCFHLPNRNPYCYQTLGFWNSATHRCE